MRILHAVRDLHVLSGGPSRSVTATAEHLGNVSVKCSVLYTVKSGNAVFHYADRENFERFEFERTVSKVEIANLFRIYQWDLVHVHGLWTYWMHRLIVEARRNRVPYVVAPRGMLEPWALAHKKMKKRIAWMLYQRNDLRKSSAIHTTSEFERRSVVSLGIHVKPYVIPNGVDIPSLQLESESGKTQADKTVLFLSRIHRGKGVDLLVKAWARVRPEGWSCIIAGPDDGGFVRVVQDLVARYKLGGSFRFLPAVDDLEKQRLFSVASVLALPSHGENFGIVIAEAFAMGIPVLTTNKTPWARIVEERCGWFVEDTVDGIAEALKSVIEAKSSQLREMGQRGRAMVERDFSWRSQTKLMKEMYAELTNQPKYES